MKKPSHSGSSTEVVVTGMGVICAAGGLDDLWRLCLAGMSPARLYEDATAAEPMRVPACVIQQQTFDDLPGRRSHKLDRCAQIALHASIAACNHAGLTDPQQRRHAGVYVGSSRGPGQKWAEAMHRLQVRRSLSPTMSIQTTMGSISGAVAHGIGATGPNMTVSATCSSAAHAIALAGHQIRCGSIDLAIAGGAEAPLQDLLIRQLVTTGIIGTHDDPSRACRPLDSTRNGTVIGEGAGFLVLESAAAARRRSARIFGRLLGWGLSTDICHETSPEASGAELAAAISQALACAGVERGDVGYINLHGTGTRINDLCEAAAICEVFGGPSTLGGHVPVCSSTKPVTGHCLGATAALEAVITVMALAERMAPPSANCASFDPQLQIRAVLGQPLGFDQPAAISTSLGFWGNNAALIFCR